MCICQSPATDQGNEVQDGGTDKTLMSNEEILTPAITEDHICLQYPNSDQSKFEYVASCSIAVYYCT